VTPSMPANDLSYFFQDIELESDEKLRIIKIFKSEGVTYEQLKSDITEEDLQELEFTPEIRNAILERARMLSTATV
jgi:hypothetical protein